MELGSRKRAANTKVSLTVSVGNRTSSCVTKPILDASQRHVTHRTFKRPPRILRSVVLPLPLAPIKASISPGATEAVMPLRMLFSCGLTWRTLATDRMRDNQRYKKN